MRFVIKMARLVLLLMILFVPIAVSQSHQRDIIKELSSIRAGRGRVRVFEDNAVKEVLGRRMAPPRPVYGVGDQQFIKMRGFKIQAFAGNNQRTSKNEADSKQRIISQAFPEHETVISFDSPFWRLRVGNFQTREEANIAMEEIKKAFPSFGREMYIVVDEVKIAVD